MSIIAQLADHARQVHFGGNWTVSNLKQQLADVSWQQATTTVEGFNTLATLVQHIGYYYKVQLDVLQGKPLIASDKESFEQPPVQSAEDWEQLQESCWENANRFAELVAELPDTQLLKAFENVKYGNWLRNLVGILEHTHYHLGQIALIKRLVRTELNKQHAIAFYQLAFDGKPREAVQLYVGDTYIQHNPDVADGPEGFIAYFERMHREYPDKSVQFLRAIAQGELVSLHTKQVWPGNDQYVTLDFFRFDDNGKILEHWDAIQQVPETAANNNTMF